MGVGLLLGLAYAPAVRAQIPVFPPAEPSSAEPPSEQAVLPPPPDAPPGAELEAGPVPASPSVVTPPPPPAPLPSRELPPPGEAVYRPPGARRPWYGWQTLITDGAALTLALLADSPRSSDLSSAVGLLALGAYGLGAPIVHAVHHNPGKGLASFGLRLGMPIAGAFAGASAASGCNGFLCEVDGAAIGMLIGLAGAVTIDATVLAYEARPRPVRASAGWSPQLLLTPRSGWVGVGGEL